jgi:alpha-N-acetylglucosamine transferase
MLTVGQLKKALKGIDEKTPVYLADHDHSEWETNGQANRVEVINQKDFDEWTQDRLKKDSQFKIEGTYVVIRVG